MRLIKQSGPSSHRPRLNGDLNKNYNNAPRSDVNSVPGSNASAAEKQGQPWLRRAWRRASRRAWRRPAENARESTHRAMKQAFEPECNNTQAADWHTATCERQD